MKTACLFAFLCCLFVPVSLFAQSPGAVETDISTSFYKIGYWHGYRFSHGEDTTVNASDSGWKANTIFREKLKNYASKYPFTLNLRFHDLDSSSLTILTANDRLFRIYSWDTNTGGTMRHFEDVFQYKWGAKVSAILKADTDEANRQYNYNYSKLYTLKANGNTYYLAIYQGQFSGKDRTEGIQVFAIENGKLNENVNLIKTADSLSSKLYYYYNIFTVADGISPNISYNEALKTISLPVVAQHGKMTNARVSYKFNGKYFEKVKNTRN
jgi:hypothetical protein